VLVLDVKTFPKTTRLAKAVSKIGLILDCGPLGEADLARWLVDESRDVHGKTLNRNSAALMVEVCGPEFGLLRQELEKLAAYVGNRGKIDIEDVRKLVGGWGTEEVWNMIRSTYEGNLGRALDDLQTLLAAGEAPQKILGGVSFVFSKLARAAELARGGTALPGALRAAGIFPQDIDRAAAYLRRIGPRGQEKIFRLLLETDAALKGGSRAADELTLERLLVELAPPSGRVKAGAV
jgi:DNA polymerase-3 subunit delta